MRRRRPGRRGSSSSNPRNPRRVSIRGRSIRLRVKGRPGGPCPGALPRKLMTHQKIRICLWFDGNAEEAAEFYVSVFKDSGVTSITPSPTGAALVVAFRLAGVEFLALNGGPQFRFNEAVSLSVDCRSQEELDELWEKLSAGGARGGGGGVEGCKGRVWGVVAGTTPVRRSVSDVCV